MKSNTSESNDESNGRQRFWLEIDLSKRTCCMVDRLLASASEKGRDFTGAVAHHLVGAMLEVMYPDLDTRTHGLRTTDRQTSRPCDFVINDAMIHVAVGPTEALVAKCQANIEQGFRPMILTLEDRIGTARSLADYIGIEDRIAVRGVEEFVAGNIDEIARYSEPETRRVLRQLFDTYNTRVAAVEPDPSLLVEIPENLTQT
ncbi:MAG: DUF4928 family protein [bacterium]|nr:DUF4928 family protein [bacterium]